MGTMAVTLLAWALASPPGTATERPDPRAVALAEATLERMGGRVAWDATRWVRWDFFGGRRHWWDRHTGDVRIEADDLLILMNVNDRTGRAWRAGVELEGGERDEALASGHEMWVNDSYWMFMPYKLLDPGVTLRWVGERSMQDGRPADVVELTFDPGVGYTPQNKYEVFVGRESGLVEQWSYWADAADAEPKFTLPWADWKPFGRIRLATSKGRGKDWNIAVPESLPRSVFTDPAPVER